MSTILLSLAAVFSAFSAYQGSRWYSEMNIGLAESGTLRDVSAKIDRHANRQILGDMMLFLEWADAFRSKDSALMLVMEDRFSQPFKIAFGVWSKQKEKGAAGLLPMGTPFSIKEYSLALQKKARNCWVNRILNLKGQSWQHRWVMTLSFAWSYSLFPLFFGAVCTKIGAPLYQVSLFWIGALIAIVGVAIVTQLPWNIGF
jgi:hypothetical protein